MSSDNANDATFGDLLSSDIESVVSVSNNIFELFSEILSPFLSIAEGASTLLGMFA